MIHHTAYAMRTATGWMACVTLPRAGKRLTRRLIDDDGSVRIFGCEQAAQAAAGQELCRLLNGEDRKPRKRLREFGVRKLGKSARAIEIAERIFNHTQPAEPAESSEAAP